MPPFPSRTRSDVASASTARLWRVTEVERRGHDAVTWIRRSWPALANGSSELSAPKSVPSSGPSV